MRGTWDGEVPKYNILRAVLTEKITFSQMFQARYTTPFM
jgi:hypothetical protein